MMNLADTIADLQTMPADAIVEGYGLLDGFDTMFQLFSTPRTVADMIAGVQTADHTAINLTGKSATYMIVRIAAEEVTA